MSACEHQYYLGGSGTFRWFKSCVICGYTEHHPWGTPEREVDRIYRLENHVF